MLRRCVQCWNSFPALLGSYKVRWRLEVGNMHVRDAGHAVMMFGGAFSMLLLLLAATEEPLKLRMWAICCTVCRA
jgi:hypothetical protein